MPTLVQCPRKVTTVRGRIVGIARRTKSLGRGSKWPVTCIVKVEFSSVLKEAGLFADLTHVRESALLGMFAEAHAAVTRSRQLNANESTERSRNGCKQRSAASGFDMVPEIHKWRQMTISWFECSECCFLESAGCHDKASTLSERRVYGDAHNCP